MGKFSGQAGLERNCNSRPTNGTLGLRAAEVGQATDAAALKGIGAHFTNYLPSTVHLNFPFHSGAVGNIKPPVPQWQSVDHECGIGTSGAVGGSHKSKEIVQWGNLTLHL